MYDIISILGDGSGFVGIQKTAPTSALDVNGTIKGTALITGAITGTTLTLAGAITGATTINASSTITAPTFSGRLINGGNAEATNLTLNGSLTGATSISCSGTITASTFSGGLSGNASTATTATYYYPRTNEWINDNAGRPRWYFANNGTNSHSYYRSGSTIHYFRDSSDVDICAIDRFSLSAYFEVVSSTTDYIAVVEPNALTSFQYRTMLIKYGSFTEFHRCYLEDELYNGNYEDFVNEYMGRVVVSTGKIKRWEKEQGKEAKVLIDKEAISIDDAQPIIKLSRKKKDKAIYGVITNRTESSDPDRICINAVGEGAIWVVNSNGNLENGDLLQTSDHLGYAERADDDLIRNYTVGKVVMDCNFELDNPEYKCEDLGNGIRRAFLACVYMSA